MNTLAVVLQQPERLVLDRLDLQAPGAEDIVVDVEWSGLTDVFRQRAVAAMPVVIL